LKKLGFGFFCGKNGKMGGNGGRRWVWVVEKSRWWYGGWWGSDGWWWVLNFREFGGGKTEKEGEKMYGATVKMGERGRKMT
jgi:hypothetical protein